MGAMKLSVCWICVWLALSFRASAQDLVAYDNALENGWSSYSWATVNFSSTSPVHSASDAISVSDPTNGYQALYLHHSGLNGSLYQSLTFWIYPTVTGQNALRLQATIAGNAQTSVLLSFSTKNQWQQITVPLTSLGVATSTNFDGFWLQDNGGTMRTFYVDDISLIATPPPPTVSLTVSPLAVTKTIDGRIYGMNLAIWDSLLAGSGTTGIVAAMQTQTFRLPGGSSSDDYNWQAGRGVSDSSYFWPNNAPVFAKVIATANAQACITVNYGSGTPEQAAAWVAYYNAATTNTTALGVDAKGRDWKTAGYWAGIRAASPLGTDDGYNFLRVAHAAPYGFHTWEVGNECYGSWEADQHGASGTALSGVAHDPYTYANAFVQFSQKMKAVDPTILLGAVANPGEDSYGIGTHPATNPNEGNSTHTGWTPVLLVTLKSLGTYPDFLIDHIYPQNSPNESDAGLLQAGAESVSDAANLRKMITDYVGGSAGAGIALTITELNSVSAGPGKQTVSLVNGLFMADAIAQVAGTEFTGCYWWDLRNSAQASYNLDASLYGWRQFGDYGVVASGDRGDTPGNTPYPAYYAAKLLTHWGRGGDRVIGATTNYNLLSVYGAKLANGNLSVLVVNKHPSTDLAGQLTIPGFTPGATTATAISYGKPNDLANGDLTTTTFNCGTGSFTYTFPSYSMTMLILTGQWEAWREANFTAAELGNSAMSGDTAAPAQDGVSNLTKYALGLNAKTPAGAGAPHIGRQLIAGKHYLTLAFSQLKTLLDVTYTVQVSSDLKTWQSGASYVTRVDDGSTNNAVYRDLTAVEDGPQRFIRLAVTRF